MANPKDDKAFIFKWFDLIKSIPTQNKARNENFTPTDKGTLTLSSDAKHLAFALGSYSDNETGVCWPNYEDHLIVECGLTRARYNNGITELAQKGFVTVEVAVEYSKGNQSKHRYHLHLKRRESTTADIDSGKPEEDSTTADINGGSTAYIDSRTTAEIDSVTTQVTEQPNSSTSNSESYTTNWLEDIESIEFENEGCVTHTGDDDGANEVQQPVGAVAGLLKTLGEDIEADYLNCVTPNDYLEWLEKTLDWLSSYPQYHPTVQQCAEYGLQQLDAA